MMGLSSKRCPPAVLVVAAVVATSVLLICRERAKSQRSSPQTQPGKADGVAKWFDKRVAEIAGRMVLREAGDAAVDPELAKASPAELARRIRENKDAAGVWAPLRQFLAKTVDKPQLRAKLARDILGRIEALRKKGKWSICQSNGLLNALIALKARRELLQLMENETSVSTCCGSESLMLAIVAMGRAEDAWPILRHFTKGGGDGWSSYFNGCMMRLTGGKTIPPGAIKKKSDSDDKAFRTRALRAWAKRLVSAKIGLGDMTLADRALASIAMPVPATQPSQGVYMPMAPRYTLLCITDKWMLWQIHELDRATVESRARRFTIRFYLQRRGRNHARLVTTLRDTNVPWKATVMDDGTVVLYYRGRLAWVSPEDKTGSTRGPYLKLDGLWLDPLNLYPDGVVVRSKGLGKPVRAWFVPFKGRALATDKRIPLTDEKGFRFANAPQRYKILRSGDEFAWSDDAGLHIVNIANGARRRLPFTGGQVHLFDGKTAMSGQVNAQVICNLKSGKIKRIKVHFNFVAVRNGIGYGIISVGKPTSAYGHSLYYKLLAVELDSGRQRSLAKWPHAYVHYVADSDGLTFWDGKAWRKFKWLTRIAQAATIRSSSSQAKPAVGNAKRAQIAKAVAEPFGQAIGRHILTIRTNPSGKAKKAADEALAEIGLPSLKPLMDYLHQIAEAKPGDKMWIAPEYIQRAISTVCKRVGPNAEQGILKRFLQTANETERKHLFRALVAGSSYSKALAHLLGAIRAEGALRGNAKWAVERVVHLCMFGGWGRDEAAISELLGIFSRYPDLKKKYREIRRHVTVLKTVGAPKKEMTFSPVIHRPLSIVVDEQTEFFIALPRPAGFGYHWGVGKGRKPDTNWRAHGLLYLGRVLGKGKVFYYRFFGTRAIKTPFNAHVQGGVPDDDPAEYPMTLTVRALSPEKKAKRLGELRSSLDEQKRKYAELVRLIDELGRADVGGVARIAAAAKAIGSQALPALTDAIGNRDTSTEAQRRRCGLARVIGGFQRKAFGAVPALVGLLRNPVTGYETHSVLMALAQIGPPAKEAVPDLIKIIRRKRASGRGDTEICAAIRAAGAIGPDARDAVPSLIEAVGHRNEMVRLLAVGALGQIGPAAAKATPVLIKAFKDTNRHVSGNAVRAVAKIGRPAVAYLIPALADEDPVTRSYCLMALSRMGAEAAPAAPALVKVLPSAIAGRGRTIDLRNRTLYVLMQIGKPALPSLAALLKDKDETLRWCAVTVLGRLRLGIGERDPYRVFEIGPALPEATALILAAMEDPAVAVRQQAAKAFGRIRPAPTKFMQAIAEGLKDKDPAVRKQVARTLGSFGPHAAPAVGAMVEAVLRDKEEMVREELYRALPKIGEGAVPALITAMTDSKDPKMRWRAGGPLIKIGKPAVGSLVKLLKHKDASLRQMVVRILGVIGPDAAAAVPDLAAALKDPEPHVAYFAAEALGKIGPGAKSAATALAAALEDRRNHPTQPGEMAAKTLQSLGPLAAPVVPSLIKLLEHDDLQVRLRTGDVLAAIGPPAKEAIPALRKALKHESAAVRWRATTALGRIGPAAKVAVGDLLAAMEDENWYVRGTAALASARTGPADKRVVPALIEALREEKLQVFVARALGEIGPRANAAIPALAKLAKTAKSRSKREAAEAALKKITSTGPTPQPPATPRPRR